MKLRVWKLGSEDYKIFPTQKAIKNLADKITSGEADIIWSQDVTFNEIPLTKLETTTAAYDINIVTSVDFPFEKFHRDFADFWREWREENLVSMSQE